jgi:UDP-glucuronate 4-epimerase
LATILRFDVPLVVDLVEAALGKATKRELLPMQSGDVQETRADGSDLETSVAFRPSTPIEMGVRRFIDCYRDYHGI